jgi:hypothetical protein
MRRKTTNCIRIVDKPQVSSQCTPSPWMRRERWLSLGRESRVHGDGYADDAKIWRRPDDEQQKQGR